MIGVLRAPGRAGPAREIEKFRVLASSAELQPRVYPGFSFQNLRESPVPFRIYWKIQQNLLFLRVS